MDMGVGAYERGHPVCIIRVDKNSGFRKDHQHACEQDSSAGRCESEELASGKLGSSAKVHRILLATFAK